MELTKSRVVPELDKSIFFFYRLHETSLQLEDWLDAVKGLTELNNWPNNFCLQFVRGRLQRARAVSFLNGKYFVQVLNVLLLVLHRNLSGEREF